MSPSGSYESGLSHVHNAMPEQKLCLASVPGLTHISQCHHEGVTVSGADGGCNACYATDARSSTSADGGSSGFW